MSLKKIRCLSVGQIIVCLLSTGLICLPIYVTRYHPPLSFDITILLVISLYVYIISGCLGWMLKQQSDSICSRFVLILFVVMNTLGVVFGCVITVCLLTFDMRLVEHWTSTGNFVRLQMMCGILQSILGLVSLCVCYRSIEFGGPGERRDGLVGSDAAQEMAIVELGVYGAGENNDKPPEYDDIVTDIAEKDGLPTYVEAVNTQLSAKGNSLLKPTVCL